MKLVWARAAVHQEGRRPACWLQKMKVEMPSTMPGARIGDTSTA
jgi:hypothetical protein